MNKYLEYMEIRFININSKSITTKNIFANNISQAIFEELDNSKESILILSAKYVYEEKVIKYLN